MLFLFVGFLELRQFSRHAALPCARFHVVSNRPSVQDVLCDILCTLHTYIYILRILCSRYVVFCETRLARKRKRGGGKAASRRLQRQSETQSQIGHIG